MIELLNKIIEFITDDIWLTEADKNEGDAKRLGRITSWIEKYDLSLKYDQDGFFLEQYKENIEKLKEIRDIYQRGVPFTKNNTKGYKKGTTNLSMQILEGYMKHRTIEENQESALRLLETVKRTRSERTFYRYKKKIKELGIEIS